MNEALARAAYTACFSRHWKTPFDALSATSKAEWQDAAEAVLKTWLETSFRQAIGDNEKITDAAAVMKVAMGCHEDGIEAIRRAVAAFVIGEIDPSQLETTDHVDDRGSKPTDH